MSDAPISIIFAGTPAIAVPTLQALIDDPAFHIQLVITQPDKPVGRKQTLAPTPVKVCAQQAGIEVVQPADINQLPLSTFTAQFLVIVAYGQMLQQSILDAPSVAAVNLHPSLLPRWRGSSPMKSAILSDDAETGVTIQRMVQQLDAGPILSQIRTPIHERETILSLQNRLMTMGAALLVQTLKEPITEEPQDETQVTLCRKLDRSTGNIDPAMLTAEEVDRHVRALVPWPGVRCTIDGQELKLIKTALEPQEESVPLECKDSIVHLVTVQPPGKKPMSGQAWQRGRK